MKAPNLLYAARSAPGRKVPSMRQKQRRHDACADTRECDLEGKAPFMQQKQ
jgi:hypothetical protein